MNFRRRKSVLLAALCIGSAGALACGHDAVAAPASTTTPPDDGADSIDVPEPGEADLLVAAEPASFTVHTYDGSGESVHPDVYVFSSPWHGRRYWYSATPYPGGKAEFENPSIFRATMGGWAPPRGVANPLARPEALDYLSDPDLVYDPAADALRLYYRETTPVADRILIVTSRDGVNWSAPTTVLEGTRYGLISPAIVREEDGSSRMWSVDATGAGCQGRRADVSLRLRRSPDGLKWDAPTPVQLDVPRYVAWHLDVQYVAAKHEYWTLVAAYPDGTNCSYTAVFFGRSADGVTWRMSPAPLLAAGDLASIRDIVYRSTFHYHATSDEVSVWFSGARNETGHYVYGEAFARYALADLLRRVERPFDPGTTTGSSITSDPDPTALGHNPRTGFVNAFP